MTPSKNANMQANESEISKFKGWEKLDKDQQATVLRETKEVWKLQHTITESELAIGEKLAKLQEVLGPFRIFVAYVDQFFHMSRATAYRYMEQYKAGKKYFPEQVLEAAIVRGVSVKEDKLREFVADNPPPKSSEPRAIQEYLSTYEASQIRETKVETSPDVLQKDVVNFFGTRYKRLELQGRAKGKWTRDTLAICLTIAGITDQVMLDPLPVPESHVVRQGRPPQAVNNSREAVAA